MERASSDAAFQAALHEAFLLFECKQDKDIEEFLREKVYEYYNRHACSVYILFNEDDFYQGILRVEAYFTLSHKSLTADPETMTKSRIKKYGGSETAKTLDFVLIGQLGKHISDSYKSPLSGKYILDKAFEVIHAASDLIPCKHVLIECSDEPKVRAVYEDYRFTFFQNDGSHNQYVKKL